MSVFLVYSFFGYYFEPNLGMASVCFLYWTQLQRGPPPIDENLIKRECTNLKSFLYFRLWTQKEVLDAKNYDLSACGLLFHYPE